MQDILLIMDSAALHTPFGERDAGVEDLLRDCREHRLPYRIYPNAAFAHTAEEATADESHDRYGKDYRSESCECATTYCMRNALLPSIHDNTLLIVIASSEQGNCCARFADVVFARGNSARFCNEQKIPHFPFGTMFDIRQILRKQIFTGHIRPRHQARLQRKEAFETE